jgi:DNA-binding response OmpR family regulator/DNA-binding CsgD family transcriptional regulator
MSPDRNRRDIALVVDDSADSLRLLTDALDSAGMTVMVALDGASALRIIEEITPDVILLDAVMPGTDGFETCRQIKRIPSLSHVPIIFMTGLTETEDLVRGLEVGGVDYVTKPIVVDEMIARIRVHLANARLAQSARAALDVAGRYLFAVDRQGRLLWSTPQAQKLLDETRQLNGTAQFKLSAPQLKWLLQAAEGSNHASTEWNAQIGLRLFYLGKLAPGELLLRLAHSEQAITPADLRKELGLTGRESEVLSWISKGKTNRDIAQILGLSPRTIDKHLEQIYAKLGVENRTAAAALAAQANKSN